MIIQADVSVRLWHPATSLISDKAEATLEQDLQFQAWQSILGGDFFWSPAPPFHLPAGLTSAASMSRSMHKTISNALQLFCSRLTKTRS